MCWKTTPRKSQHAPHTYTAVAAIYVIVEGSLEVKLPTIWTDGKAEVGRVGAGKSRREKIREEKD